MKFEHFALNVPEPRAMAAWYVAHLGFRVLRANATGSLAHFLADDTGRVCFEIYRNPAAPLPDYAAQPPLVFHFAVFSADAPADRARLVAAGATLLTEETLADGSVIVMLRDPWGVALQLCQRAVPFPGF
jgi:catechol 2,3-dioxygenase-like lactoylglutathione lyase family enzyme